VDAAANAVAHEAMVSGFEAVTASAVRKARPGVTTSDGTSMPMRTRWAVRRVRTPMSPSTTAPRAPRVMRTGVMPMSEAAPAMPSAPYNVSTVAAPAPTARPGAKPWRRVVRMHRRDTGPT
jgi:hypothetical protein